MNISKEEISQRVLRLRKQKGLTQTELSKLADMNQSGISGIESGKREIHIEELPRLAEALETSVQYITTGIKPENLTLREELGLSDYAIEGLKHWNKENKETENGTIISQLNAVIEALIPSPLSIIALYEYLYGDFEKIMVVFDDKHYGEFPVSDICVTNAFFTSVGNDLEPLARIKLMDYLRVLRKDVKEGGFENGQS